MKIRPNIRWPFPSQQNSQTTDTDKHSPRECLELGLGTLSAASKLPFSVISGVSVGGYHGALQSRSESEELIEADSVGLGLVATKTAQDLGMSAALSFTVLGPLGASLNVAKDGIGASIGAFTAIKSGAARSMGEQMAQELQEAVPPGTGLIAGFSRGSWVGIRASAKSQWETGFREGQGLATGLCEGLGKVKEEWQERQELPGHLLQKSLSSGLAVASSLASTPAAITLSLVQSRLSKNPLIRRLGHLTVTGGTGAALGLAANSHADLTGQAIAAASGAALSLLSASSAPEFLDSLAHKLDSVQEASEDLGSPEANFQRNLSQGVLTAAAHGLRKGWDKGVELLHRPQIEDVKPTEDDVKKS